MVPDSKRTNFLMPIESPLPQKPQNIWGVGRNFKDHAKEMKSELPASPLIFLKSGATINTHPHQVALPSWVQDVHHEVELAVQITDTGTPLQATIALDLTERHYQNQAKKAGLPWTLAKSFKGATALGPWLPWSEDFLNCEISLSVNQKLRQQASLKDLIFSLPEITQFLLNHFPVCHGDLILMGTPAGVALLLPGDLAEAQLGASLNHHWQIKTL